MNPISDDVLWNIIKSPVVNDNKLPCEFTHNFSCEFHLLWRMQKTLKVAAKVYFIIHTYPYLLHKRKQLKNDIFKCIREILKNFGLSLTFLIMHMVAGNFSLCKVPLYSKGLISPKILGAWFMLFHAVIFVEQRKRVEELTLYLFPRWIEVIFNWLLAAF